MSDTKKSIDPAALEMLEVAAAEGLSTAFSRADKMKPCPIGHGGNCCAICFMGPCRMVGKNPDELTGICGAKPATIAARNISRFVAGGAAAHSDHGRDLAFTLLAASKGEAKGYSIKDPAKLHAVCRIYGIKTEGRSNEDLGIELATKAIAQWGQQTGECLPIIRAPKKRQEIWRKHGVVPRGIDREIVETMHRTTMGVDQDPEHLLLHAIRTSLTDGWCGSMLATDISDILFGTPSPVQSRANLGVLREDQVNVVVHGHEPTLSEMIVAASRDPEMLAYAKSKGATGINLAGICCTANEVLVRQGVPSAGNFLEQELAIITGAVDAMVVDIQCVMQAVHDLSTKFHTKVITTSPKARIKDAMHIQFDDHDALPVAKLILKTAIDNFPNRRQARIPDQQAELVAGFSHEYITYMLGGVYRASFRALNDAIIEGRIKGAVGVVGCNNPRTPHDQAHYEIVKELIANDFLVVQTGCGAIANAKFGLLTPDAVDHAGPGLREVCEAVGIPPVLHMGSCVDNSRILTVVTQCVLEGGLGDDISDLPVAGMAPEWMSEKAISIGAYVVASGIQTYFGVDSPVSGCPEVADLMNRGWTEKFGAGLVFEPDTSKQVAMVIDHIMGKRRALKLGSWAPGAYSRTYITPQAAAQGLVVTTDS